MTEDEAKAEAAEAQIRDNDESGEPTTRPGLITDALPSPYKNKREAEAKNNGAAPPDLSLMAMVCPPYFALLLVKDESFQARHGGDDYIFALLTSYFDPPAGVPVDEGKAYNPYFPGGVIAMPQQLFDEQIEYRDGTPATQSQMAKDVTNFMRWAAEPWHDKRKRYGLKAH